MVHNLGRVYDISFMDTFTEKYAKDLNTPLTGNMHIEKIDEISSESWYEFTEELLRACLPPTLIMNPDFPTIEVVKFLDSKPHRDLSSGELVLVVPVKLSTLADRYYLGFEDSTCSRYEYEIRKYHRYLLNQYNLHWVHGAYPSGVGIDTVEPGINFNIALLFNVIIKDPLFK